MKSVLISIRPEWCEKIVNGKVTIEVRKSAPKEFPFKAYIYCTKAKSKWRYSDYVGAYVNSKDEIVYAQQHIIGEFVCDYIYEWEKKDRLELIGICPTVRASYMIFVDDLEKTCLTYDELDEYGKGKTLYGWHISDLKIYDKPKELSKFYVHKHDTFNYCCGCVYLVRLTTEYPCSECLRDREQRMYLTRPPQSWQFVEEVKI